MSNLALSVFARTLDEIASRAVGFDNHVERLFTTRTQIAQLRKARTAVYEHVKRAAALGHEELVGSDGLAYEIRTTEPKPPVRYLSAPSAAVKAANPLAWRRAVVPVNFVQVTASTRISRAVRHIDAPDGKAFMPPGEAVTVYQTHSAWYELRRLKQVEAHTITALQTIAAEFDWDGGVSEGPMKFGDGWTLQLRREQYSSDELKAACPDVFDQVAVAKLKQSVPRVYVRRLGITDEGDDLDDMDEIDGD